MIYKYKIIRTERKTIAIQIDKNCNIIVRAPLNTSSKVIDDLMLSKKEWIERTIVKQKNNLASAKKYTDEEIKNLRIAAKNILPQKVKYFSEIMGVTPAKVKINSAKTRYGSCSGKNNLNFSLYLMDKDERFIDYVVIHELAHIKHHNHSKEFYSFVSEFMPNYKEIEKLGR